MVSHGNHQPIISYIAPQTIQKSLRPKPVSILTPLIFFSVTGASLFPFVWGLMAGLRCCTSHGVACEQTNRELVHRLAMVALFQSRGWLPNVEALDTPGSQPLFSDEVVNGVENRNYTKYVQDVLP